MKFFILAGGGGTRLFPLSKDKYPKQFIKFFDDESLLQKTVKRALKIVDIDDIIFLTNKDYVFLIKEQVADCFKKQPKHIILEPVKRNTAPAISLGMKYILEKGLGEPHEPVFVFPADHLIQPEEEFVKYINEAQLLVKNSNIVTFGILPSRPETGYGYIEADKKNAISLNQFQAFKVKKFHEKPSLETAQKYIDEGNFYWNSGIFGFTPETFLKEVNHYCPVIFELIYEKTFEEIIQKFNQMPDISVDYAVMEKTDKAFIIPMSISWSDVGSFEALYEIMEKDSKDNFIKGKALLKDTERCLVCGDKRLVIGIGVKDLMVVDTEDVLLIARKGEGQRIKEIVEELKGNSYGNSLIENPPTSYRPWGSFTVLEENERYKVKKIIVKPGESLSLQMHHHRSEHWVVVRGIAMVVMEREDGSLKEVYVHENESVFIPKTKKHRLINPGKVPLEIIEVQVGEYLEEDDIIRFEDVYGRERKF